MGAANIGGSVPANLPIGATLGTAFAIAGKLKIEEALVIAVPAAVLGSFFELLAKTVSTVFVVGAERAADRGSARGISLMVHLGNLFHFLAVFLPFFALALGGDAVKAMSAGIPTWLRDAIRVAGNLLPALGFGMLLSTMATSALIPWFFLGFIFAAYAKFGVLGAAFPGCIAAAIFVFSSKVDYQSHPPGPPTPKKILASLIPPADRRTHLLALVWPAIRLQF